MRRVIISNDSILGVSFEYEIHSLIKIKYCSTLEDILILPVPVPVSRRNQEKEEGAEEGEEENKRRTVTTDDLPLVELEDNPR